MLVGAEEDDPPFIGKKRVEKAAAQQRRDGDAQHLLQPFNGCGAAGTAEEQGVVRTCSCAALDVTGCLLDQLAHVEAHVVVYCVGVPCEISCPLNMKKKQRTARTMMEI